MSVLMEEGSRKEPSCKRHEQYGGDRGAYLWCMVEEVGFWREKPKTLLTSHFLLLVLMHNACVFFVKVTNTRRPEL